MKICLILEGAYPYVTGGVSSWTHQLIKAMPQHEFVIWVIGASSDLKGKYKYELPENVTEVREVFLNDALEIDFEKKKYNFSEEELNALKEFINCKSPDWETLFSIYHTRKVSPVAFLMSEDFLDIMVRICKEEYPYTAFSDFFHTVRSMMLPVLYLIQSKVPKADMYHSIATGYAGILARLGSYENHVPYMITEHGIYTREREEEIIRADWVIPSFKHFWVKFFYMLSNGAYAKATLVTCLFERVSKTQIELGCPASKSRVIMNGIDYDRFSAVPPKENNGLIDIGAVLRIAPIKDVKTLIYAFAELRQRLTNVRLWICGPEDDKDYAKECYDLVEQLQVEEVHFTGTVNVVEWLAKFDFTMLTSISEGQPLSVLESFAAGRPCVTTDVGCCRELIHGQLDDDLGDAGYCVPPMNVKELCLAMERMSVDYESRFEMGKVAKMRVQKYYLHKEMVKNYQRAYDEVMEKWRE